MNCPHHPANQRCSVCDPSPVVRRITAARTSPERGVNQWLKWPGVVLFVPTALVAAYLALGMAVAVCVVCPLLPFIVIGAIIGVTRAKARAQFTKQAIDYAAVRLAEELAARR